MRRPLFVGLTALCAGLAALLGWLWVTPQGQLKGVSWQPPAVVKPVLDGGASLGGTGVELGRFVATLDRPLFLPTRRPPPPPQAASAAAVDPFPDVRLLAVYGNAERGGALTAVNGQLRRTKVGDSFSGWTLKSLSPTGAEFARGDEVRSVDIKRVIGSESLALSTGKPGAAMSAEASRQADLEDARRRVRNMNAVRAKYGFAPLPEP